MYPCVTNYTNEAQKFNELKSIKGFEQVAKEHWKFKMIASDHEDLLKYIKSKKNNSQDTLSANIIQKPKI